MNPPPYFIALSPDNHWCLAWPYDSSRYVIWDASTGQIVHQEERRIFAAAFSPDGRRLILGGSEEYRVLETDTWSLLYTVPKAANSGQFHGSVEFSADSRIAAVKHSNGSVRVFDGGTGGELATIEPQEALNITSIALSADGRHLALAGENNLIQLWDLHLIRRGLAAMKLDWDLSSSPPATADKP